MKFFRRHPEANDRRPVDWATKQRTDASRPCVGDGMGEPSTCQTHMAAWYRAEKSCEFVRASQH